ncbi:MAG: two-component system sensor histidine kinase/response regulator [Chlamydiales bacterium]|jgi:two-component system sensor histidine kinase/response regulator
MPDPSSLRPAILVVDDQDANRLFMTMVLDGLDADVVTASSGMQALEASQTMGNIAVILMAVQMQVLDGFETAEILRRNVNTQATPLIFVSEPGHDPEEFVRGYECGAVDFLTKPVPQHALRGKVSVFLKLNSQQAALERALTDLSTSTRSREALEPRNAALDRYTHAAAHDLQSPVRHIRFRVGIMLEDHAPELSEHLKGELLKVDESAGRMQEMMTSLLAYARLGGVSPEMSDVPLDSVLARLLEEFELSIAQADAEVDIGEMPMVVGNSLLLGQLFQNLLSNALKFRRFGVRPRIRIRSERCHSKAECSISVSDNGIGFDMACAQRLFEPFRRLVPQTQFEGSGIGIATASRIVELHGGSLAATGQEGHGATFTVTLPMAMKLMVPPQPNG